jgi:hypothetical protein
VALPNKTAAAGAAFCGNIFFPSTISGLQIDGIVIFRSTGLASTSNLIAFIDGSGSIGLPVTTNGSSLTIVVPVTSPGLFKL